jgi:N-acetylglucosaminyl-diphospho-decaprenol L-rhamnosyltransferase
LKTAFGGFQRYFSLVKKALNIDDGRIPFKAGDQPFFADWVVGMFMLFTSDAFRVLKGFDEKYFMYYEDVDICARGWRAGHKVLVCPNLKIVHEGRRKSRRIPQHLLWHLQSFKKYSLKH